MAGSIITSKGLILSINSFTFDYLVDRIAAQFDANDIHIKEEVYRPMEEGAMTFISARPLDAKKFSVFSRAVMKASVAAQSEPFFARFEKCGLNCWKRYDEIADFKFKDRNCKHNIGNAALR